MTSKIIACVWDFDKTLIPGNMQDPLFKMYNVHPDEFWKEVNNLSVYYQEQGIRASGAHLYLNHILTYTNYNVFPGLTNTVLRNLGKEVEFCEGIPDFLAELTDFVGKRFGLYEITLEHYVLSTGMVEMIKGSGLAELVDGVWGAELIEMPAPPRYIAESQGRPEKEGAAVCQIGMITDKTTALFEINKGVNKDNSITVNSFVPYENRRIPFEHMLYIADGESDIPAFSVVNKYGGTSFGVYSETNVASQEQIRRLSKEGRISDFGPSVYVRNGPTAMKIKQHIERIGIDILKQLNSK